MVAVVAVVVVVVVVVVVAAGVVVVVDVAVTVTVAVAVTVRAVAFARIARRAKRHVAGEQLLDNQVRRCHLQLVENMVLGIVVVVVSDVSAVSNDSADTDAQGLLKCPLGKDDLDVVHDHLLPSIGVRRPPSDVCGAIGAVVVGLLVPNWGKYPAEFGVASQELVSALPTHRHKSAQFDTTNVPTSVFALAKQLDRQGQALWLAAATRRSPDTAATSVNNTTCRDTKLYGSAPRTRVL